MKYEKHRSVLRISSVIGSAGTLFERRAQPPLLQVRLHDGDAGEQTFSTPFSIGRDAGNDVQLDSAEVSRTHAEVTFREGNWWLTDSGSTNGTLIDGRRIEEVRLDDATEVRLGLKGPKITLTPLTDGSGEKSKARQSQDRRVTYAADATARTTRKSENAEGGVAPAETRGSVPAKPSSDSEGTGAGGRGNRPPRRSPRGRGEEGGAAESGKQRFGSTEEYVRHYFGADGDDGTAGDHTRMIRRAYAQVNTKQRRKTRWIVAAALVLAVGALSFALYQQWRVNRAQNLVYDLREQEAEIARIRTLLEDTLNHPLQDELRRREAELTQMHARYEGFIEEYGIRRDLSEEEEVIFKVARIFNESHTHMPHDFVRAVRDQIRVWQTTGRATFVNAIRHAEEQGYTGYIVRTFQRYDLPPEFYYLALQESQFRPHVVGPPTPYGYAKGMWQFIPETGEMYGLTSGPRVDDGVYDEGDDRHDFRKSTDAAARYLRDIYGYLTQASGLLAMASYNWGEHRVISKLEPLMEGIPDEPEARSYWRFYSAYSGRMPEQTKDYVIKIFSAAVIGENPRLFGFDFDNPLRKHMEEVDGPSQPVAQAGGN